MEENNCLCPHYDNWDCEFYNQGRCRIEETMKPLLPNPKPKTDRDKKYLGFIRTKRCLFCNNKAEPHHESGLSNSGGMALKCSDYFAIQLCRFHHDERDRLVTSHLSSARTKTLIII